MGRKTKKNSSSEKPKYLLIYMGNKLYDVTSFLLFYRGLTILNKGLPLHSIGTWLVHNRK